MKLLKKHEREYIKKRKRKKYLDQYQIRHYESIVIELVRKDTKNFIFSPTLSSSSPFDSEIRYEWDMDYM